jgi:putative DNA primase/helicase
LAAEFGVDLGERAGEGGSVGFGGSSGEEWPDPKPLAAGLPDVEPLCEDMVPEPFRAWLCDIAERCQAPLDFAVVGALITAGSVIGRAVAVRPKLRDDWQEVANLWGAVVGRSGIMKSPTLKAAMAPLHRLVAEANAEYDRSANEAELQSVVVDARVKAAKKAVEQAVQAGEDPAPFVSELQKAKTEVATPACRRFLTNDPTVEALGILLNQNSRGILVFRDELTGWLRTLDRDGHENDRSFYLEAWDGSRPIYIYDRVGRGTLRIESPCVSILGGIQPGPLADYIKSAVHGGVGDDGLMQRFQLAVFPDVSRDWRNVDRWPDSEARNRSYEIYKKLSDPGLAASTGAFSDPDEPGSIPFLRLASGAQARFDLWREPLERQVRSGTEHPAIESHLSKYRKLVPALALLFHIISVADSATAGPVSEAATEMAVRWARYLETHARRIYATVTRARYIAAALLAAKLRAGKVETDDGLFSTRDVYRQGWTGLDDPEVVKEACEELVQAHWLRAVTIPAGERGGRPTVGFRINPKVRNA